MAMRFFISCAAVSAALVLERPRGAARPRRQTTPAMVLERPTPPVRRLYRRGTWPRYTLKRTPPAKRTPPVLPPSLPPAAGSLDDAGPLYLSLSALFGQVGARLAQSAPPYDSKTIADVLALLRRAALNPTEWEQFTARRADRYTRNVVAVDERFVALLLTWDAQQASSVHDHAGSSCFVKLLSGDLVEQKHAKTFRDGVWRTIGGPEAVREGDATYMDDSRGLHRISNPSEDMPAVSLHIYAPGFEQCGIYGDDGAVGVGSMVSAMTPGAPAAELAGRASLAELGEALATLGDQMPAHHVAAGRSPKDAAVAPLLARVELTPAEQREYCSGACFSEFGYVRHLAHVSDRYSVVVCCWLAGQASDRSLPRGNRHVHGADRSSWTRVLHGQLEYEFPEEGLRRVLGPEDCFSEEEWMKTTPRRARNPGDSVCVSLHVRSPPLTTQDFEGSGRDAVRHAAAAPDALAAARVKGNNLYTSLNGLSSLLDEAFAKGSDVGCITNLLTNCKLNEREWRSYARWDRDSFSRVLIADREEYNMFLVSWERGNFSPVHDHAGSASWTKVLEGALDEAVYGVTDGKLALERTGPMAEGVTFAHAKLIHGCVATNRCFTLQLYSPPYRSANAYAADGSGEKVEIPTYVRGDRDGELTKPVSPVLDR